MPVLIQTGRGERGAVALGEAVFLVPGLKSADSKEPWFKHTRNMADFTWMPSVTGTSPLPKATQLSRHSTSSCAVPDEDLEKHRPCSVFRGTTGCQSRWRKERKTCGTSVPGVLGGLHLLFTGHPRTGPAAAPAPNPKLHEAPFGIWACSVVYKSEDKPGAVVHTCNPRSSGG